MNDDIALASLISSRICHDLISPVGAISNGLELLAMSGVEETEELALISDSARTAAAALKFMRIAFGAGSADEMFAARVLGDLARGYLVSPRLTLDWPDAGPDVSRDEAKLAFLLAIAAASALPFGGALKLNGLGEGPQGLFAYVEGRRAGFEDAAARQLCGDADAAAAEPRLAPLALLAATARRRGLRVDCSFGEDAGRVAFI